MDFKYRWSLDAEEAVVRIGRDIGGYPAGDHAKCTIEYRFMFSPDAADLLRLSQNTKLGAKIPGRGAAPRKAS